MLCIKLFSMWQMLSITTAFVTSFTVKGCMFQHQSPSRKAHLSNLSRSSVQDLVMRGDVTLTYFPCLDKDAPVQEGDMISLRHHGKARVLSADGKSKKGRTFVTAGIFK